MYATAWSEGRRSMLMVRWCNEPWQAIGMCVFSMVALYSEISFVSREDSPGLLGDNRGDETFQSAVNIDQLL